MDDAILQRRPDAIRTRRYLIIALFVAPHLVGGVAFEERFDAK